MATWDIQDSTLSKVERVENYLRLIICPATILSTDDNPTQEWLSLEILLLEGAIESSNLNLPDKIISGLIHTQNMSKNRITLPYKSSTKGRLELQLENHPTPIKTHFSMLKTKATPPQLSI